MKRTHESFGLYFQAFLICVRDHDYQCWEYQFGDPDEADIELAKQNGYHVEPVTTVQTADIELLKTRI